MPSALGLSTRAAVSKNKLVRVVRETKMVACKGVHSASVGICGHLQTSAKRRVVHCQVRSISSFGFICRFGECSLGTKWKQQGMVWPQRSQGGGRDGQRRTAFPAGRVVSGKARSQESHGVFDGP